MSAANEDNIPDPAKIMKLARQALSSAEYRRKFNMADFWGLAEWYEPQLRFFAAGIKHHQRLIRGGNQTGKTFPCAFETALHLTGAYPRWWTAGGSRSRCADGSLGRVFSLCAMERRRSSPTWPASSAPALSRSQP
jgi:hypothetical protein